MIHPRRPRSINDHEPARRSRLISRYLDPEYNGQSTPNVGSLSRSRSPPLPQPSVFVDRYGEEHDPDFRPFASYPVVTPAAEEHESWPWDNNEDSPVSIMRSTSPRSGRMSHSNSHSTTGSYLSSQSSGTVSGSASVLPSPSLEPETPTPPVTPPANDEGRRHIAPPAHIPRSALFPWTPAQRAVRVQHEVNKRNIPPPPPTFIEEEHEESPLTLVDSRYVPGYGHLTAPPSLHQQRAQTEPATGKDKTTSNCGRARAHTVPVSPASQLPEDEPPSPTCSFSLRQSVYSFGLKTKLGLHHMKARVRKASNAAKRPLSL